MHENDAHKVPPRTANPRSHAERALPPLASAQDRAPLRADGRIYAPPRPAPRATPPVRRHRPSMRRRASPPPRAARRQARACTACVRAESAAATRLPRLLPCTVCNQREMMMSKERINEEVGRRTGTGLPLLPRLQHHSRPLSRPAEPSVPDAIEAPWSASSEARVTHHLRAHTTKPRPPRAWKQIGGDDHVHAWKQARNRHQFWMEINDSCVWARCGTSRPEIEIVVGRTRPLTCGRAIALYTHMSARRAQRGPCRRCQKR